MKHLTKSLLIVGVALLTLQGAIATAIQPDSTGRPAASTAPDRQALVKEILGLWESAPNPVNARNEAQYPDLRAALKVATVDQLLDAQNARTLDDLWAVLPKGARGRSTVVPLAAGRAITPLVLGDPADDLVFTPVTPCRIVDTRGGVAPYTGILGPNGGNGFQVALSDYSPQGGFAGSCGIPTNPYPAAVAINVTSAGQTGTGNLRVIQSGAGVPNTSLVNYVAGVNIANAAVVRSTHLAGYDIYVYSGNSQSHAVVDIMGYFNPPALTMEDNEVLNTQTAVAAATQFDIFSPACDAGYRLLSGGINSGAYNGIAYVTSSRPAQGASNALVSGTNTGDRWICQGITNVATTIRCTAICARIPGH